MEAILVFDEAEGLFGRRNAEAASSSLAKMVCFYLTVKKCQEQTALRTSHTNIAFGCVWCMALDGV